MDRVERNRCEPIALIRFPLVDPAVAVRVLFGRREPALLVMLDARHLAVPLCGDFDARDEAVGAEIRPRVLRSVVGAREADLLQLLVRVVMLPALDLSVLVFINFDTYDARAVHVAERVGLAVAVRIVFQQLQTAGRLVVFGRDARFRLRAIAAAR